MKYQINNKTFKCFFAVIYIVNQIKGNMASVRVEINKQTGIFTVDQASIPCLDSRH
jgi:hypothetical protein